MGKSLYVSVVGCIYNEEKNLEEFNSRMTGTLKQLGQNYEIIYIDDGSTDGSSMILEKLARENPNIKVIQFTRNFGQHIAISAGFDHVKGERILLIDTDLQESPEDLFPLMGKMDEGYNIVYGVRSLYRSNVLRRMFSHLFFKLLGILLKLQIPENLCSIRLMDQRVIRHMRSLKERTRFITGLMFWHGFSYAVVNVSYAKRLAGKSGYTFRKLMTLAKDGIFAFTSFPLKIALYLGLLGSFLSSLLIIYILGKICLMGVRPTPFALFLTVAFFLSSVQFLLQGIIGEYVGRVYVETLNRPLYVVDRTINLS